jgi:hypothetical protein
VAVRSTPRPGPIALRAASHRLEPASLTVQAQLVPIEDVPAAQVDRISGGRPGAWR